MISIGLTISCCARGPIWRAGSRIGKWVLNQLDPRGRRSCKWCPLRMLLAAYLFPWARRLLFRIWKKKSLVFLLEGLHFDIISRHPLNLMLVLWTDKSLLLNSKFSRPKMMSCSFQKLQFLEYYQEKKSSSLNSVRPQGALRKRLFL